MSSREHVLIVGGGIAGLALAAGLDPRRFRVTLVEEQPDRAGQGTVLGLWPQAVRVLEALERLGDGLRAASFAVETGSLRDARGRVLVRSAAPGLALVPRPALVDALEGAAPHDVTRLTRPVTDPLALGKELGADLVVGADGVRSTCRRAAFPGADPVDTGWVAVRGHLDRDLEDAAEWWGPGGVFGTTPGPRGTAWFCAVRRDRTGDTVDPAEALALADRHFADWDPRLREILRLAGDEADVQRLLIAPPLRTMAADGLVLIGDAAHGMAPNLGRGANEAIHDAACLGAMLHRHGTKGAPPPFVRRRHLPTQAMRLASSGVLRMATSTRWAPARDRALRLLP